MKFQFLRNTLMAAVFGAMVFQGGPLPVEAASSVALSGIRCHSGHTHDRIVLDLEKMPSYRASLEDGGYRIQLELDGVRAKKLKGLSFSSDLVRNIRYREEKGKLKVSIYLKEPAEYKVDKLQKPSRIFVDVLRPGQAEENTAGKAAMGQDPDITVKQIAPGLVEKIYNHWYEDGPVTAYFLEADKNLFAVRPALARGHVPGRQVVSGIADDHDAVAAINASYFALDGDLIGITKIDGTVVGTTYFTRTAFGIMPDDSVKFGKIDYNGNVTLGKVTLPVAGVDCERGEDCLILYNRFYGSRTGTNEYGKEYVVRDGTVVAIGDANTLIPQDGVVVSVHGAAKDAFAGVKVGDKAIIQEDLGEPWNEALQVMGVGPRLVQNGRVHVTAGEEQFPSDIRYGRAPRSAFGVTKDGNYLFAVVDGRQSHSHGCTLTEFGELLQRFGAVEALNFDGGGSSELVVNGEVVNSPSDGDERAVGSALLLLPRSKT